MFVYLLGKYLFRIPYAGLNPRSRHSKKEKKFLTLKSSAQSDRSSSNQSTGTITEVKEVNGNQRDID